MPILRHLVNQGIKPLARQNFTKALSKVFGEEIKLSWTPNKLQAAKDEWRAYCEEVGHKSRSKRKAIKTPVGQTDLKKGKLSAEDKN